MNLFLLNFHYFHYFFMIFWVQFVILMLSGVNKKKTINDYGGLSQVHRTTFKQFFYGYFKVPGQLMQKTSPPNNNNNNK